MKLVMEKHTISQYVQLMMLEKEKLNITRFHSKMVLKFMFAVCTKFFYLQESLRLSVGCLQQSVQCQVGLDCVVVINLFS